MSDLKIVGVEDSAQDEVVLHDVRKKMRRTKMANPPGAEARAKVKAINESSIAMPPPIIAMHPPIIIQGNPLPTKADAVILDLNGHPIPKIEWPQYIEFRRRKCPYFNYAASEHVLDTESRNHRSALIAGWHQCCDELSHAIHEFVGEAAELAELGLKNGVAIFLGGDGGFRDKLIDEAGDVAFCAAWVADACGSKMFAGAAGSPEVFVVEDNTPAAAMARIVAIANRYACPIQALGNAPAQFQGPLMTAAVAVPATALMYAGLLCNRFKKLRYQLRSQDLGEFESTIARVLEEVNKLLVLAGSTIEEAMLNNMDKLNKRFPDGWKPGGGNRLAPEEIAEASALANPLDTDDA